MKHSLRVKGKIRVRGGDSWEGRLKEVLGVVVNHASSRQVQWTQGKEGGILKNVSNAKDT